jgi:LPXTG-motif cell wall-anchored protein
MKKHTTSTGPTGFGWLRSLVAFRHRNPLGRLLSTLVAFAIASLLVVGTGAAYADDTEPAPTDTSATADPTSDPTSDPASDPAPDASDDATPPADESADSGDTLSDAATDSPADSPADGAGDTSAPASSDAAKPAGPVMRTLTTLAKDDVTPNLVGNASCQNSANTMVGGFEIDADPCDDAGGIDFNDGPGATTDDGYGDSGNWFTQGSSENDNPADWTLTGSSNTGKADIGTAWAFSHTWHADPQDNDPTDGHVFAYFGFTNDSTAGGTQDYSLEYNQADPVNGKPVRTVGDLLFHFFANGSAPLDFEAAYIYTDEDDASWTKDCVESGTLGAGWCPFVPPGGLTLDDVFTSAVSPTGEYAEGAIDITALFGEGNCSGTFGTTFLRSAPGAFFTSELKDYVSPLDVTTPSTCGSLVITKVDADTEDPVGGGVYQIDPDPRPGADPGDTLCIYDGPDDSSMPAKPAGCDDYIADGTADGTVTVDPVEPGTYTVTELVPPPGYLLNGGSGDVVSDVEVGEAGSETSVGQADFANRKAWEPLTVDKTAHGTYTLTYPWTLNKQISETGEAGTWVDDTTPGDPLVKNVGAGGETSLYYRVLVDHAGEPVGSAYVVKGVITVHNTNDAAVDAALEESLPNCTLDSNDASLSDADGAPITAAANDDTEFHYTCALGNTAPPTDEENSATITWDMDTYPQEGDNHLADTDADHYTADTGDVSFQPIEETASIDKTVVVVDDNGTPGDDSDDTVLGSVAWADAPWTSNVYSNDPAPAPGSCSAVITNTASIFGDGESSLMDSSESGQVCQDNAADLTVAATVQESLVRTFPWTIDKATSTPNLQNTGGPVVGNYSVTVTAGEFVDSAWAMSGTVTVENPNDFEPVDLTGLTVDYTGAADETCTVHESAAVPIPASGSQGFTFDCVFPTEPSLDGAVVATATWDGAAAGTSNSSAHNPAGDATDVTDGEWDVTPVNETTNVWDDNATPADPSDDTLLATLHWADVHDMADHQQVLTYSITLTGLPAAGACNDHVNTAEILGDEDAFIDDDDATVRVCTPAVAPPVVSPPQVLPPSLPNTGGPDAWLLAAGLGLVLVGGLVLAGDRRRKHRS